MLVDKLLAALALVMVIEGIWPFLAPESFRRALMLMASEDNGALRLAGLVSMLSGVGLLYWIN